MHPVTAPLPTIDVKADFWSLRFVEETSEAYCVRKNVAQPLALATDRGVMASVYVEGGYGYAATADTSPAGLRAALDRAAAPRRARLVRAPPQPREGRGLRRADRRLGRVGRRHPLDAAPRDERRRRRRPAFPDGDSVGRRHGARRPRDPAALAQRSAPHLPAG